MSSLTGSSTLAQVMAAYDDNSSYEEDNSIVKARAFITACRILIRRTPTVMQKASNELSYNVQVLQQELRDAFAWLLARDPTAKIGPDVTTVDFRNFRNDGTGSTTG